MHAYLHRICHYKNVEVLSATCVTLTYVHTYIHTCSYWGVCYADIHKFEVQLDTCVLCLHTYIHTQVMSYKNVELQSATDILECTTFLTCIQTYTGYVVQECRTAVCH